MPQSSSSSTSVFGQLAAATPKRAVAVADAQLLAQAGHPLVQRRVAAPAGVLRQRAGQPGLARAGGAGDQHAVAAVDPVAQRQAHDRAALQAPPGARLSRSSMARLRVFQASLLSKRAWRLSLRK